MKFRINRDMIRSVKFLIQMSIAFAYIVSLLSLIFAYTMSSHFTWGLWLDTTFIIALILLAIGGSLFIIQGGFFSKKNDRYEEVVEDIDADVATMSLQVKRRSIHPSAKIMIGTGLLLVVVTMVISYYTS